MKKNKVFIMADKEILAGTTQVVLFPAPNIQMQIQMNIPVHVFHGKRPGPKLFLISTMHGDELNGIEIIRRVHQHLDVKSLAGTVITLPVANIYGAMMRSRYMVDRRDLNRSFPGKKTGSLAVRLAYGIMQRIVVHCDYGIDLHTGAIGRTNMPQLRVDFSVPKSKAFAQSFAAPVILESKQRMGSLREAASRHGIPVIVYEGGEALRLDELCVRGGVKGILNVLSSLKMLQTDHGDKKSNSKSVITSTSRWLRAPVSGLVEPAGAIFAAPVKKGEILANIHDPFLMRPPTVVVAPFAGIVIGQSQQALVTEGDALYHLASFKKITGVKEYIDEYKEEMASD